MLVNTPTSLRSRIIPMTPEPADPSCAWPRHIHNAYHPDSECFVLTWTDGVGGLSLVCRKVRAFGIESRTA